MRERDLELYLKQQVVKAGGICWKWTSPGLSGVPDRIVILPGGLTTYVELKAPGKKPTKLQEQRHKTLRALGADVFVLDSIEGVDVFMVYAKKVSDMALKVLERI